MKSNPLSTYFLLVQGIILIVLGGYFIFLRPAVLPEDLLYMNTTLKDFHKSIPRLSIWLQKVFLVTGGYIFTTGLLTVYISQTSFCSRVRGVFIMVLIASLTSIGSMTVINFMLNSDFKLVLLACNFPWITALTLYLLKK